MLMPEIMDRLKCADIDAVDIQGLSDIREMEFDNARAANERLEYAREKLGNPFCFRYGNMGIKLEFDDGAPTLTQVLTDLLLRKKSGL